MDNKGMVLVANMRGDSVSVFDMERLRKIGSIAVKPAGNKVSGVNYYTSRPVMGPGYLYYYTKSNLLFVVNVYDDSLSLYNMATEEFESTLIVGRHPSQVAAIGSIDRAFVTNYDSDSVTVIDLSARETVGQIPCGIMPQCIFLNTQTYCLYIANAGSDYVSVIDGASLDKLPCLKVYGYPVVLAGDSGGQRLFAAVRHIEREQRYCLVEYDLISGRIARKAGLGYMPSGMLLDEKAGKLYIIDAVENNLRILNTTDLKPEKVVRLGRMPLGQCADTPMANLYVVCALDNCLYKIDISQGRIVETISTGTEPVSVICID